MKDIRSLLPIGSIVVLKGGVKELMIFGVMQTNTEDKKEYDYIGVMYPEGNIGQGFQYLFNSEDIEKVIFRGYENDEREEFLDILEKAYAQNEK